MVARVGSAVTRAGRKGWTAAIVGGTAVACAAALWVDRELRRRYGELPPLTTIGGVVLALLLILGGRAGALWRVACVAFVVVAAGGRVGGDPLLDAAESAAITVAFALLAALVLQRDRKSTRL